MAFNKLSLLATVDPIIWNCLRLLPPSEILPLSTLFFSTDSSLLLLFCDVVGSWYFTLLLTSLIITICSFCHNSTFNIIMRVLHWCGALYFSRVISFVCPYSLNISCSIGNSFSWLWLCSYSLVFNKLNLLPVTIPTLFHTFVALCSLLLPKTCALVLRIHPFYPYLNLAHVILSHDSLFDVIFFLLLALLLADFLLIWM